eukprot:2012133-Amphidinium_carterae.1
MPTAMGATAAHTTGPALFTGGHLGCGRVVAHGAPFLHRWIRVPPNPNAQVSHLGLHASGPPRPNTCSR